MMTRTVCLPFLLLLCSIGNAAFANESPTQAQLPLPTAHIRVTTREGEVLPLQVELARTQQEQETGLMFRKQLPEGQGMLFLYQEPHEVTMWMRNTEIPLDILFISSDNKIVTIRENAIPQSLEFIRSNGEAAAVLEVPAGTVASHDITIGNSVVLSATP